MRLATTLLVAGAAALIAPIGTAKAGATLDAVKKKGFVQCGVSTGLAGFSKPDAGNWSGLDVDVCRAVAAAIFGDAKAVSHAADLPATLHRAAVGRDRRAVAQHDLDAVAGHLTRHGVHRRHLLRRPGLHGAEVAGGQERARASTAPRSACRPAPPPSCNLADYFRANKMSFSPVNFERSDEARAAYEQGRCDALTTDQSGLYADRTGLKNPNDHIVLPEVISKEPLGPVVRHGDNEWGDVVRGTLYAMVEAEDLGVSSANVDDQKAKSTNPEVRRLLGAEDEMGKDLGLPNDWGYQIIKQVGNYGEMFERNVGMNTPLKIARGLNAQWKDHGLQYAMPIR